MDSKMTVEQIETYQRAMLDLSVSDKYEMKLSKSGCEHIAHICDLAKLALSSTQDVAGLVSELQTPWSKRERPMPTVDELQKILNSPDQPNIELQTNGTASPNITELRAADALLSQAARIREFEGGILNIEQCVEMYADLYTSEEQLRHSVVDKCRNLRRAAALLGEKP